MRITKEQLVRVRNGESVVLDDRGTTVVLLRADVFEHMQNSIIDFGPWSDDEMDMLAAEDADRLGWEGMEAYQEIDQ